MTDIHANIAKVQARIQQAATKSGRCVTDIMLLAVSKTQSAEAIEKAYHLDKLRHFGENYAQEAIDKQDLLKHLPLIWHFIGPIQSNKTRLIAERFQWCHSLDRLKIAQRLQQQRPPGLAPLNVCIEVNIDNESSKSGLPLADLSDFVAHLRVMDRLSIRGLMVIPAPGKTAGETLDGFRLTADRLRSLKATFPELPLDTLSMGMSADLELAIAAGSTIVRVGTDIFGARKTAPDQP